MNENIIYIVILFIVFLTFIILRKYIKDKKTTIVICFVLFIAIFSVINIYQNMFLHFKNINNALNYSYPNTTIKYKTQYEDYVFVIYKNKNTTGLTYFINDDDGYKYHKKFLFDFDMISYKNFNILRKYIKKHDICYVYIDYIDINNKEIEINNISETYLDSKIENIYEDYNQYSYSFIVEDYSNNPYIYINGEMVKI